MQRANIAHELSESLPMMRSRPHRRLQASSMRYTVLAYGSDLSLLRTF